MIWADLKCFHIQYQKKKKITSVQIFCSHFHSMFIVSLLCLCSCLCSQLLAAKMWHWEKLGSFGGMRCCFSAWVMLSVSGQAPGLDVTLKEVLWDSAGRRPSKPTAKLPHLHSCKIARGYSAGQDWNSQKMASAACSHDDRWQGASCHSRRAHNGSSEGAESLDVSQTLLAQNRASTLEAGSSSSININLNDDWWGWTSWSD